MGIGDLGDEKMSQNILIVDEHANFRFLIREWLKDVFPCHGILEAKSGEEAFFSK